MKHKTRSKCCNAEVRLHGIPDFLGTKRVCTSYYLCVNCGKACDVNPGCLKLEAHLIMGENSNLKGKKKILTKKIKTALDEKQEILSTKRKIKKIKRRLVSQGVILKKFTELLDGITIDPKKGVILSKKKMIQLAELQNMFNEFESNKKLNN